jgi:uncharacterized protein involved in copper resistance
MALWEIAIAFAIVGMPTAAMAQDDFPMVDWGPTMQTEAMNSAMDHAARQGSGQAAANRSVPRSRKSSPKELCAKVRGWAAAGEKDPRIPRMLGQCRQLGY